MVKEIEIGVVPSALNNKEHLKKVTAAKLNIALSSLKGLEIIKRSIDARSKRPVYRLRVKAYINEGLPAENAIERNYKDISSARPVVIIGAGPAGLFAALRLIELGLKPVIFERGKDIRQRRRDLAAINRQGLVNPESNYCFGEGGAGTYSDGKLYTRSTKRGDVNKVLQTLVFHGAPADILIDARPHIGTNKLPGIIEAMRQTILNAGGEIHFETKLTSIVHNGHALQGIETNVGVYDIDKMILATGHSAHDIFYLLHKSNITIEAKAFALGLRIEHPQKLIDQIQYHCADRGEYLPPAYYSLVEQVDGRGVFSFCMCPGGIIAPCATNADEIVVNGWSPSKRNNPFANSGMVVQITPADWGNSNSPLAALQFQQKVEQLAFQKGGGLLKAPAQRMVDFVQDKLSTDLPSTSYLPGVTSVQLKEVLPEQVNNALRGAFKAFDKKMKGYFTNEAVLVGVESRTSSPIKIPRNENLQHPDIKGLFPCGEGAGYAGGIVSAAIDGEKCAEALA